LLLFATPVAYSMKDVPEEWRLPLSIVNPLAPIIDGFRRCLLYSQAPQWEYLGPAALVSFALLAVGYVVFKRLELGFADVA
jgi:ABC-type polysaccharide/polyol phosphate export permease